MVQRARSVLGRAVALGLLVSACSPALAPVTPEQGLGLRDAQRIADEVTTAYGMTRVRLYASSNLPPAAGAGYSYRYDWIFIRPELLSGDDYWVVLSHELGHATLGHGRGEIPRDRIRTAIAEQEHAANRRGVEIMTRFGNVTERQALDRYATYFIEQDRRRSGRADLPVGHRPPCDQLRELWVSFGQNAPPCGAIAAPPEVRECPYDDWMGTKCKAGQSINPPAGRNVADRLRELKQLRDERLITDEEYEMRRRAILDQI